MQDKKVSNSRTFRESPWHINSFFSKIDRFGQTIPAFNLKGKDKVTTTFGGITTAAIIVLTLSYFVIRFEELVAGTDPTINYNVVQSYYGAEKGLNLYESNERLAISVIGANDNKTKYDPRYVRMIAQYYYYSP